MILPLCNVHNVAHLDGIPPKRALREDNPEEQPDKRHRGISVPPSVMPAPEVRPIRVRKRPAEESAPTVVQGSGQEHKRYRRTLPRALDEFQIHDPHDRWQTDRTKHPDISFKCSVMLKNQPTLAEVAA